MSNYFSTELTNKQQFPMDKAPLGSLKALTNSSVLISSKRFKASRGSGWIFNRLRRQLFPKVLERVQSKERESGRL